MLANALPGDSVPYYMDSGEGGRYEISGPLVTVIARAAAAGGIFSAAYISSGTGVESPFVTHAIDGSSRRGNTPCLPDGKPYTRFLNWMDLTVEGPPSVRQCNCRTGARGCWLTDRTATPRNYRTTAAAARAGISPQPQPESRGTRFRDR